MTPRLVAVSGPLEGSFHELDGDSLSIGRHESNDLLVTGSRISRRHCVLRREDGGWRVEDLDSRHGTRVNGASVTDRRLEHGDILTLGETTLLFLEERARRDGGGVVCSVSDSRVTAESTVRLSREQGFYLHPEKLLAALPAGDRSRRALAVVLRLGATVGRLRTVDEVGSEVVERLLEAVPAQRAAMVLTDAGTDEPTTVYAAHRSGARDPFTVSGTVLREALGERVALLAENVVETPRVAAAESVRAERIHSLICVPVILGGEPAGALYLDTRLTDVALDDEHLALVTAIAGLAAAALDAARHLEWLEGEKRRLETVELEHDMVGESVAIGRVLERLARVAPTDSTLLIRGESGTGKELAARAVHRNSDRSGGPFVAINCAVLTETLLESELFGHEKGAFTGAVARKTGKLEVADGGTLFFDEVGELPPGIQAKLLRVLEERQFERLGGTRPIRVDVRILAATNRDLEKAIADGDFREDLFYRLNVIACELPPLRERPGDVPLLAEHFVARHCRRLHRPRMSLSGEALEALGRYRWPGNVRELANAIERAVVLGGGDTLGVDDLPEAVLETAAAEERPTDGYHDAVTSFKRELVRDALGEAGGVVTVAARALGLNPNYLHRLINNLDLRDER